MLSVSQSYVLSHLAKDCPLSTPIQSK